MHGVDGLQPVGSNQNCLAPEWPPALKTRGWSMVHRRGVNDLVWLIRRG
jgi:hypothetical protein